MRIVQPQINTKVGHRASHYSFHSIHKGPTTTLRSPGCKSAVWKPSVRQGFRLHTTSTSSPAQYGVEHNETLDEEESQTFNWSTHWYPVMTITSADPSTPYPFTLLGKEMVMWRDREGEWSCLEDRCSHRQVPLSRGRFNKEDGNIMCSFHGWSFNKEGKCTHIPQVEAEKQESLCKGARSSVQSYPVMVKHGSIWVWPDESPSAWVEASMTGTGIPDEYSDIDTVSDFVQEFSCSYQSMVEMSLDPTHAPFVHEGTMFQANPAQAIPCKMERLDFGPHGFKVSTPGSLKYSAASEGFKQFIPPSLVVSDYSTPTGPGFLLLLFFVPTSPGKCRLMSAAPRRGRSDLFQPPKGKWGSLNVKQWLATLKNIPQQIANIALPQSWIIGLQHSNYLGGASQKTQDMFLVSAAEKIFMGKEREWKKNYYMPTKSDLALSTFWQWLDKYSKGMVQWAPGTQPASPVSLEEAFERWNYHSKHCIHCRKTVKGLIKSRGMLQKVGRVSLFASVLALVFSSRVPLCYGILGLAFANACMFACQWLEWRTSFFYSSIPPGNQPGNVDLGYRETTA